MSRQIKFDSWEIKKLMHDLGRQLAAPYEEQGGELQLKLPPKTGTGQIRAADFRNGISLLLVEGRFRENIHWNMSHHQTQPLCFYFVTESGQPVNIQAGDSSFELGMLQSALLSNSKGLSHHINFRNGSSTVMCMIMIDRKKFTSRLDKSVSLLPTQLRETFEDLDGRRSFLYTGHCGLSISEAVQRIVSCSFTGLARSIFLEAQSLEIVSRHLRHFTEELQPGRRKKLLHRRDYDLIVLARQTLLEHLAEPPTIPELAQMVGTNENKLKAGFRILYDTSINKLLQDERLIRSKMLLAEGKYPIKEVATMVGYKHSAHFAAKFKKKFGVLPYEYMKSLVRRGRA